VLTHGLLDRLERTDLEVGVGAELPADPEHEGGALHWHADHDANGNVTERTDPKGVTVVARYGVLDRLETERYPEPFLNPTYPYPLGVTYAYDGNGNVTEKDRWWREHRPAAPDSSPMSPPTSWI